MQYITNYYSVQLQQYNILQITIHCNCNNNFFNLFFFLFYLLKIKFDDLLWLAFYIIILVS